MRAFTTLSILQLLSLSVLALPNPFHRCHAVSTPTIDTIKPLSTGALLAGVLAHASPNEIASIIESNPGDLGGEEPMPRRQRQRERLEYETLLAPIISIRRSFWNLLGWREWIVSVEWRGDQIPIVEGLERNFMKEEEFRVEDSNQRGDGGNAELAEDAEGDAEDDGVMLDL